MSTSFRLALAPARNTTEGVEEQLTMRRTMLKKSWIGSIACSEETLQLSYR